MTTIPEFRQGHGTCGGVKLIKWAPNPYPTSGQRQKQ